MTFVEEARTAMREADLPAATRSSRARRWNVASLAADDLRRSLPGDRQSLDELRDLAPAESRSSESVMYGPRPPAHGEETMRRVLHGGLATLAILSIAGCQLTLERRSGPGRMISEKGWNRGTNRAHC